MHIFRCIYFDAYTHDVYLETHENNSKVTPERAYCIEMRKGCSEEWLVGWMMYRGMDDWKDDVERLGR